MRISMSVPYDEERLRRTVKVILKPQLKTIRVLGAVLAVLGIALVAVDPSDTTYYTLTGLGLMFVFAIAPVTVAKSMRMQSKIIRDGYHMSLDDEWATVSYPLAESRFRWAGLDRIIETPEEWFLTFGKAQAIAIPKAAMTDGQRNEFAAFVARLPAGLTDTARR